MTTGRMMLEESDVEIPGALPLILRRTHFSTYRAGFRFGRTWASTIDQRLEVEDGEIGFAAEDGTLLAYPVADGTALPVEGPYWPLKRSPEGGYVIEQPELARMLYFAEDGAGRLPLTAIFDNDGNVVNFCHDALGNLTEIRHSGGTRIEVETSAGFVTALTLLGADETDRTELVRYRYDRHLRLTEVLNSSGLPMRYGYDDQGRVIRWRTATSGCMSSPTTSSAAASRDRAPTGTSRTPSATTGRTGSTPRPTRWATPCGSTSTPTSRSCGRWIRWAGKRASNGTATTGCSPARRARPHDPVRVRRARQPGGGDLPGRRPAARRVRREPPCGVHCGTGRGGLAPGVRRRWAAGREHRPAGRDHPLHLW
jgi:YD repeat-containing protein